MTDAKKTVMQTAKTWLSWLMPFICLALFIVLFKKEEQLSLNVAQEVQLQREILKLNQQLLIDEAIFTGHSAHARRYLQMADSVTGKKSVAGYIRMAYLDQQRSDSIAVSKQLKQLQLERELQLAKLEREFANLDGQHFREKSALKSQILLTESAYSLLLDSVIRLNSALDREKNGHQQLSFMNKTNRVFYIGSISDSMANGNGSGIWQTGGIYTGQWKNNVRHGYGKYRWADGEQYEGEYVDDRRNGQGSYYWLNGDVYIGEWEQDRRNGYGILRNGTGKIIAQGRWKDDQLVSTEPLQ